MPRSGSGNMSNTMQSPQRGQGYGMMHPDHRRRVSGLSNPPQSPSESEASPQGFSGSPAGITNDAPMLNDVPANGHVTRFRVSVS